MPKIVIVDDDPQVVSYDSTLFNDPKISNDIEASSLYQEILER